jgi:alkylation response protein AidB-like acyl-CoA dehydrogenase
MSDTGGPGNGVGDGGDGEAEFTARVRQWLRANAPRFEDPPPHRVSLYAAMSEAEEDDQVARARAWEAHKHAQGWSGLAVPREYGGAGLGIVEDLIFAEEEAGFRLPLDVFSITRGMVVPTLLRWGGEAACALHLPPMLRGEMLWCQLFSEPDAGSDLASLRSRARRGDDGGFVVDGQKVWTSHAFHADWGYLLARTGTDRPPQAGISAFVLDMRSPGVEVRRLVQLTGRSTFNEIFLSAVRLEPAALLGPLDGGWQVATTTLMNERVAPVQAYVPFDQLFAMVRSSPAADDALVLDRLARVYTWRRVITLLRARSLDAVREGRQPGPEGSVVKLLLGWALDEAAAVAMGALGDSGAALGTWSEFALASPGLRIGGGTEDVMRNLIAERVLGMPREPRGTSG